MNQDEFFMSKAIELALQGRGRTSPNPLSASIVVNDSNIVGSGFYSNNNDNHSEYYAIQAAGENTKGATLYTVVEPCFNNLKDYQCSNIIKESGIKRVVIAIENPNPNFKGKGVNFLFENKIELKVGVLKKEAEKINETFIKYYSTKLPFINIVYSMTFDGKTSTSIGDREWILSNESKNKLHELRLTYDAVMVGVNTIIRYNPQLNCKLVGGRNPIKIILDSYARTPTNSKIFIKNNSENIKSNVIIVVNNYASEEKINELIAAGAEVIRCSDEDSHRIDLKKLLNILSKKEITSILSEGGGNLHFSEINEKIADKVSIFLTPKIVGGKDAPTPVEGEGISLMSSAIEIKNVSYTSLGNDLFIEGYF
ncbi:MAG: riboflavin biosynthesis protein RibD [Candidatus Sericytochromatia bacterium]|nr:MAG: riboflavin biosynthesis protein RibD [Candidatus Sericytochromatia bacterium]